MISKIKHKKIIKAYLKGKNIQFFLKDKWYPLNFSSWGYNPITNPELEWRTVEINPLKNAAKEFFSKQETNTVYECVIFRAGWTAMGNYLVNNKLIEKENIPKIKKF